MSHRPLIENQSITSLQIKDVMLFIGTGWGATVITLMLYVPYWPLESPAFLPYLTFLPLGSIYLCPSFVCRQAACKSYLTVCYPLSEQLAQRMK